MATEFSHPGCFLKATSNCSQSLSREHFISRSILEEWPEFTVAGMPWQMGGPPKKLGPNALAARILCKRHNEALSPLDNEALRTFRAIGDAQQEILRVSRSESPKYFITSGEALERWGLKTFLGLYHSGIASVDNLPISSNFSLPAGLEGILFNGNFSSRIGLYLHRNFGEETKDQIGVAPLLDLTHGRACGIRAVLRGISFDFIFERRSFEAKLAEEFEYYRPWALDFDGPERSARIYLTWPSSTGWRKIGVSIARSAS